MEATKKEKAAPRSQAALTPAVRLSKECAVCMKDVKTGISCQFCAHFCCTTCLKKVIISQPQAQCMECKKLWTPAFMRSSFTKTWLNSTKPDGYRGSRRHFLIETEKSKLPYTFEVLVPLRKRIIENRVAALEIRSKGYALLTAAMQLLAEQSEVEQKELRAKDAKTASSLAQKAKKMGKQADSWREQAQEMLIESRHREQTAGILETVPRVAVVCPCPVEGCRGMVSSDGRCLACEAAVCTECFVLKDDKREDEDSSKHICDPKTLATVAAIKAETKTCPKCATRISKIDGCDQLWCTQCNTAFLWSTGAIIHGLVHTTQPPEEDEEAIPEFMHHSGHARALDMAFKEFIKIKKLNAKKLNVHSFFMLIYSIQTIRDMIRDMHVVDREPLLDDLRVDYCLNRITEDRWKKLVFRIREDEERNAIVVGVLTELRNTLAYCMTSLSSLSKRCTSRDLEAACTSFLVILQILDSSTETIREELAFFGVLNFSPWTYVVEDDELIYLVTQSVSHEDHQ